MYRQCLKKHRRINASVIRKKDEREGRRIRNTKT